MTEKHLTHLEFVDEKTTACGLENTDVPSEFRKKWTDFDNTPKKKQCPKCLKILETKRMNRKPSDPTTQE